ncbi:hypothetical protein EUA98_00900 [Pengzhenrongella frigida]|uniref:Uncharacterized protein n=2 Tax=Pengzhenrongella frigida TaxID=1259133 RepID=A0A4Q5N405_9MICO|nr:hypothetical protein EUA98_00900 [Cellulomonas sp. HLT2-17]
MRWWSPWRTLWWIAALFVVGSACFALGALPVYVDRVGSQAAGVTFFVGSLFFTSAAALQALDSGPSSDRATRAAGLVQLAGTLFFNVSTFAALRQGLTAPQADRLVWTPDVWGSVAFLVASALAFADVPRPWLTWRPRDRPWTIAAANMVGSIAFGVSAVASRVVLSTDTLRDAERANLGTFVGALCFLVGGVLLLPGPHDAGDVDR